MAANLQIIFYRKGDASPAPAKAASPAPAKAGTAPDVLVKVLYNEIEQALPVPCGTPGQNADAGNTPAAADAGNAGEKPSAAKAKPAKQNCPAAPYYRWEDFREFYSKTAK